MQLFTGNNTREIYCIQTKCLAATIAVHLFKVELVIVRGYIVAHRAPSLGEKLNAEENKPIHTQDVEQMLKKYFLSHPAHFFNNSLLTYQY